MLIDIFFIIISNLLFLYIFWLRLKEDYTSDQIFSTTFYIIAAVLFANIVSRRFFPTAWFWFGFAGLTIGVTAGILRFRLRVMETLEAGIAAILPSFMFVFLADFVRNGNLHSGFGAMAVFGLLLTFFALDKHYKSFGWYKSGRVGFSGLTVLGILFLTRSVVATKFTFMLSFSGRNEIVLSAVCAFVSFLGVFNLARR